MNELLKEMSQMRCKNAIEDSGKDNEEMIE